MTISRRKYARVLIGLMLSVGLYLGAFCLVKAAEAPAAQNTAVQEPAAKKADSIQVRLPAGQRVNKNVKTFLEFKRERAVLQRYDFSCGAAALATLMQYYFKLRVSEESIVMFIINSRGAEEAVKRYKERKGFSLLDLKQAAQSAGFRCPAYRDMTLGDLVALHQPAIVPIRTRSYDHFVLFRGLKGDRVYLADPVAGNVTMKAANFVAVWNGGIGMVFESKTGLKPTGWEPDEATQGFFVSQDMVRAITSGGGAGYVARQPGQF